MDISNFFRNASPQELKNGYVELDDSYICLLCGRKIEKSDVSSAGTSFDAGQNDMRTHVANNHGSEFEYLIHWDKMQQVVKRFEMNRTYKEREVNAIIKEVCEDYVTLRRYLIEFGYMDRKADGSQYWLKQPSA